ncbi:MAG: CopD family protein [Flavobacteriales bacterium]|nr:CopD family protein [Flavobacteriales bacterium]
MGTTYIISVFLHVLFAAFWIGGMLFLPLVLLPSIKDSNNRIALLHKTGLKFRFYGWVALIGLMVTGLFNMHFKGIPLSWDFFIENDYGQWLGIKLLAFALMIAIGSVHDFYIGNKAIEQMQDGNNGRLKYIARWSGRINLLLSFTIAFIGVALSRGGI